MLYIKKINRYHYFGIKSPKGESYSHVTCSLEATLVGIMSRAVSFSWDSFVSSADEEMLLVLRALLRKCDVGFCTSDMNWTLTATLPGLERSSQNTLVQWMTQKIRSNSCAQCDAAISKKNVYNKITEVAVNIWQEFAQVQNKKLI